MAENSAIEWTDHTFNPWIGCTKVSPGCDHCYAEQRMDKRLHTVTWGPGQPRKRTSAANWRQPIKWNSEPFIQCAACSWRGPRSNFFQIGPRGGQHTMCPSCACSDWTPARQRVFCASLADVFDNEVDPAWRDDLFALINATPNLDWLLLTKRIGNVPAMLATTVGWLPKNVWLGITVVNQAEADRDIPKLLQVPAAKRFLSMEPLLGRVDLTHIPVGGGHGHHELDPIITANVLQRAPAFPPLPQIDWVIVGGESGPNARPMHPDWARSLRDQCTAAGVPFLFKQWGEWAPLHSGDAAHPVDGTHIRLGGAAIRVGKKAAGRQLDGRTWDEVPA